MKCVVSSRYSLHKGHVGSISLALNLALFVWSMHVPVSSLNFILAHAMSFIWHWTYVQTGMANGKGLDDEQGEGGLGCGVS